MKKLPLLFAIISISLLTSAQSFEGIVTMIPDFKTKPENKDKMVFYIKGDKVAMEPNGSGPLKGKMVGSRKTKEYYMLVEADGRKIALNMNMDQMRGMNPSSSAGAQQEDHPVKPTIKETGVTRMIDGYSCRQILTEMNGTKSEMWITKDVDLSIADLFFSPNTKAQSRNYGGIPGMVLEAWNYGATGRISSSVKATPEKKAIDDKMFVIPEDYVKMDMTQLMQAAQGNPEMMQQMKEMFDTEKYCLLLNPYCAERTSPVGNGFDLAAATYDCDFSESVIGKLQRSRVHHFLLKSISDRSQKILEINCGTGEDALWLARLGNRVIATDASEKMIEECERKISEYHFESSVQAQQVFFSELKQRFSSESFDLIFSDFGGLNCVSPAELSGLSPDFSSLLKPGGKFVAVIMGRKCLWERFYFFSERKI